MTPIHDGGAGDVSARRVNIRAILRNPVQRQKLLDGMARFLRQIHDDVRPVKQEAKKE
jgi:hypothetical protein